MAEESASSGKVSTKVETPFYVSQLQQAADSYRMVITLETQIITVLVLANVTLAGYAAGQRIAGILLFGPLFPIGIIASVFITGRSAIPMLYTYLNLERKYGHDEADWLGRTFVSFLMNPKYVERLLEIGSKSDWTERMELLKKMPLAIVGTGKGIIRACLVLVALVQIAAAFVLWGYYGWRMF